MNAQSASIHAFSPMADAAVGHGDAAQATLPSAAMPTNGPPTIDASPLLASRAARSDDPTPAHQQTATPSPQPITVIVEQLVPLRGHALQMDANDTVRALRGRFAAALATAEGASNGVHVVYPRAATDVEQGSTPMAQKAVEWRLVYDGVDLKDDDVTLGSLKGLCDGGRIVAISTKLPRDARERALFFVRAWWPLLLGLVCLAILLGVALGDGGSCDRPLRAFAIVGVLVLIPYLALLAGAMQPERGYRLLWFIFHEYALCTRLLIAHAVFAFVWLVLGGLWVFSDESSCTRTANQLHSSATAVWAFVLLVNTPWVVIILTPCFALCRVQFAFDVIRYMGGGLRYPENGFM